MRIYQSAKLYTEGTEGVEITVSRAYAELAAGMSLS